MIAVLLKFDENFSRWAVYLYKYFKNSVHCNFLKTQSNEKDLFLQNNRWKTVQYSFNNVYHTKLINKILKINSHYI